MFSYSISDNNVPCLVESLHPTAKMDIIFLFYLSYFVSSLQFHASEWTILDFLAIAWPRSCDFRSCVAQNVVCFLKFNLLYTYQCNEKCIVQYNVQYNVQHNVQCNVQCLDFPHSTHPASEAEEFPLPLCCTLMQRSLRESNLPLW